MFKNTKTYKAFTLEEAGSIATLHVRTENDEKAVTTSQTFNLFDLKQRESYISDIELLERSNQYKKLQKQPEVLGLKSNKTRAYKN